MQKKTTPPAAHKKMKIRYKYLYNSRQWKWTCFLWTLKSNAKQELLAPRRNKWQKSLVDPLRHEAVCSERLEALLFCLTSSENLNELHSPCLKWKRYLYLIFIFFCFGFGAPVLQAYGPVSCLVASLLLLFLHPSYFLSFLLLLPSHLLLNLSPYCCSLGSCYSLFLFSGLCALFSLFLSLVSLCFCFDFFRSKVSVPLGRMLRVFL